MSDNQYKNLNLLNERKGEATTPQPTKRSHIQQTKKKLSRKVLA